MSWNPDNKDKDPWNNRPGNQGPPDLDEVVKKNARRAWEDF